MPLEPIHCPHCNAYLDLPAEARDKPRLACPRCGETIVLATAITSVTPPQPFAVITDAAPPPRNHRRTVTIVLGIMLVMAAVGFTYALFTERYRRGNDNKNQPDQLVALVYWLPTDCSAVGGVHLKKLREDDKDGSVLNEVLQRWPDVWQQLERRTSLKPADIEQVVAAVRLHSKSTQGLLLVRTNEPYNLQTLAEKLAPTKPDTFAGRPVYRLKLDIGQAQLWCAGPQTLVLQVGITVELKDLATLPTKPAADLKGWQPLLRENIEQRVDKSAFLWLAGDPRDLQAANDALKLFGEPALPLPAWLSKVPVASASVAVQKGLTFIVNLHAADVATGKVVQSWLQANKPPLTTEYQVFEQPPPAEPQWIAAQARFPLDVLKR